MVQYAWPRGSLSLRGKYLSRRGEGGEGWQGGPLWSPAVPRKRGDPAQTLGSVHR